MHLNRKVLVLVGVLLALPQAVRANPGPDLFMQDTTTALLCTKSVTQRYPERCPAYSPGARETRLEYLRASLPDPLPQLAVEEIEIPELRKAIREATIKLELVPVLCGAALKNKGIQPLLDGIIDYLPSPVDIPPIIGNIPSTDKEEARPANIKGPFSALVFSRNDADPFPGRYTGLIC